MSRAATQGRGFSGGSLSISPDLVLFLGPRGELVLTNVRARSHIEVSLGILQLLRAIARGVTEQGELEEAVAGEPLRMRSLTVEGTLKGLFADPTNLDTALFSEPLESFDEYLMEGTLDWLIERLILVTDEAAYRECLGLKRADVDDLHVGNFYQHLTEQLTIEELEPEAWWTSQKFEPGVQGLRPGLYQHVQRRYLAESFPPSSLAGAQVLDLGCGPGYYSALFADRGADVLGLDPSAAHLEVARRRFQSPTCRFRKLRLRRGAILPLVSERFDLIFIGDTLLFYFTLPHLIPIRDTLLKRLHRLLKPGGKLVVMDPHGAFWLTPWLGSAGDPFTILTEYGPGVEDRRFRVTPTVSELVNALTNAGFLISRLDEPLPDPGYESVDPRGYHFARRFPLWWVVWAGIGPG